MSTQDTTRHHRLAQLALRAGGRFSLALAGGHAIAAHGILERPSEDVDLFADWHRRADFPAAVDAVVAALEAADLVVEMEIGPVLHPDDVMAGKMYALYNRAAARDFLDIDAAITRGRYTRQDLCDLAAAADAGFDRSLFAAMLGHLQRLDDEDFAEYGATPDDVAGLRRRVAGWRQELLG